MVVLNFYGKIPRICISKKLGLYLSNLPNEDQDNWQNELANQLYLAQCADRLYQEQLGADYPCGMNNLYKKVYPDKNLPTVFMKKHYDELASTMIYLDISFNYDDMPLGGWETNCFDGRFCEEDYAEKIINFIIFLSYHDCDSSHSFPKPTPQWTYSSNHDGIDHYRIFGSGDLAQEYIHSFQK